MGVLTSEQIAEAVILAKSGQTLKSIGNRFGVTEQAIWQWVRCRGLSASNVAQIRYLTRRNRLLERRERVRIRLLRASAAVFRLFEPSPKRRTLFIPLICSRYNLSQRTAKRLLGLSDSAGENVRVTPIDRFIKGVVEDYLKINPRAGFPMIFKELLKHKPASRTRALAVYTEFFKSERSKRLGEPLKAIPKRRMATPHAKDQTWSMDFMHAALPTGKRFWILNVIDDFNRELVISKVTSRRDSMSVTRALDEIIATGRRPARIRSDHGGEFISNVHRRWARKNQISRIYIRYRTPSDNSFVESFNGSMRRELLNCFAFKTLEQAQQLIDSWCLRYNFVRPQSSLGDLSPMQYSWLHRHDA